MFTNLLPRTRSITGADCTGSDGDLNRTYVLPDTGIVSSGVDIIVNGTSLHQGAGLDFVLVGETITFLNAIFDSNVIRVNYWITFGALTGVSIATTSNLRYSTPSLFAEMIGIKATVPSRDISGTPTNEAVGTGDGTTSVYYLAHENLLQDSLIIYADDIEIEEVTDYTIDYDKGKITLTAAGMAECNTKDITATYDYVINGMSNSYLIRVLLRAEREIDARIGSYFTDGSATNPQYPLEVEIQPTEGMFMERFISKKKPLIDIESSLEGTIDDDDTTITLSSGAGSDLFPVSGYLIIGDELITYTGATADTLTGCSRGVLDTTAVAHSSGDVIHTTVLFMSDTEEGSEESWTIQPWRTHMNATENGLIYRFYQSDPTALARAGVANRFKLIYLYGYKTLPADITRLALILAKRMLVNDNIGKALIAGRNEFQPEMANVDQQEIEGIVNNYIILPMGNV